MQIRSSTVFSPAAVGCCCLGDSIPVYSMPSKAKLIYQGKVSVWTGYSCFFRSLMVKFCSLCCIALVMIFYGKFRDENQTIKNPGMQLIKSTYSYSGDSF